MFLFDSLCWCVSDCIRTANAALFWVDSFWCVLVNVSVQQMVNCSESTVCICVLATVSGQQMLHCFGVTVCIGLLATVSDQQMLFFLV